MVRTIYQQPSAEEVTPIERVVDQLSERFPQASSMLAGDGADVLAFTSFPGAHWKQVWSNNRRSVSRRSGAGQMWWESSRTGRRCVGSSVRYSLNSTTSGQSVERYLTPGVTTKQEASCRRPR